MAARIDSGSTATDDGIVFPVRYFKAKNEHGHKAARTASLDSSQIIRGQLGEQSVLVHTKTCSATTRRRGECYGRGVLEEGAPIIVKQVDVGEGSSKTEFDGSSLCDGDEQVEHLKSCIHLCLEEAFYLVHCKQCLTVYVADADTLLTAEDFWKQCCKRVKNFVHKYVVYHYYRNKGWVPKPGTKFGVHFLLYKDGPSYYHSSYGVIVRSAMSASELTWQFIVSLVRTMDSVNKGAIICEVKTDQKEVDLSNPSCISHFTVVETLVNRWVPKQDRN